MRLLIVRLPDAQRQAVAFWPPRIESGAVVAETLADALAALDGAAFDLAILLAGAEAAGAAALRRLRERHPDLKVTLISGAARRGGRAAGPDPARLDPLAIIVGPAGLRVNGHEIALSDAELRLFTALWSRRGQTMTSEQLLGALYPGGARPSSRVLPVFLFKLRRKLAEAGADGVIRTAVGRGFVIPASEDDKG